MEEKKEEKKRPVNPILATNPEFLPRRPDNIWTVPRFRRVIGGRRIRLRPCDVHYYIGGEVAIAAVCRWSFMAGRFTFAVPRRTENHVHIPRGINNSSVSIRVGFSPGGVRCSAVQCGAAVSRLSRGRETAPRKKISTMAFVPSRSASSVLNKIKFLSP